MSELLSELTLMSPAKDITDRKLTENKCQNNSVEEIKSTVEADRPIGKFVF